MTSIVDTNVILIANGQHADVSQECVATCALRLQDLMENGKIALDDAYEVLLEYQNKTQPKTGNRPGDAFVKWALQNNRTPARCDLVPLETHHERGYVSFPEDPRLANFDPPDRKFVALSVTHPDTPPILQAADSKWLAWAPALKANGVEVEFLCPDDIERFRANKAGK